MGILLGRVLPELARGPVLSLVALPGIWAHELAHYLVARALLARPQLPRLWPRRSPTGTWILGSVSFVPGWLSAGPVALAPLWILGSVVVVLVFEGGHHRGAVGVGLGVFVGQLLWGVWPSREDWHIALRYPLGSSLVVLSAALLVVMKLNP